MMGVAHVAEARKPSVGAKIRALPGEAVASGAEFRVCGKHLINKAISEC